MLAFKTARRQSARGAALSLESLESRDLLSVMSMPTLHFHPAQVARLATIPSSTITVNPGDSIQNAVDQARPGATIFIKPGVYDQTVTVTTDNLKIIGLTDSTGQGVVLEGAGAADTGITVASPTGGTLFGFTLKNITVRDFTGNGVLLIGVDGFSISHVTAINDAEYGIFPVFCTVGTIQSCAASGSNDTGIYVGQSQNVVIRNCVAFNNVNGIEIENSSYTIAANNICFGNTVGILDDLLPQLTIETSTQNQITGNIIYANNRANSAPAGDIAAVEPPGIGILVVGGDHATVRTNFVFGNGYAGIALVSGLDLITLAGLPPSVYGSVDPNPEHTVIADNILHGNGLLFSYPLFPPGADLLWDGSGSDNHWHHNFFGTSDPPNLPS